MMNEIVSSNDYGAAAFKGAVSVADLVLRNKYLEAEIASYCERMPKAPSDTNLLQLSALSPAPTTSETLCGLPSNYSELPTNALLRLGAI